MDVVLQLWNGAAELYSLKLVMRLSVSSAALFLDATMHQHPRVFPGFDASVLFSCGSVFFLGMSQFLGGGSRPVQPLE